MAKEHIVDSPEQWAAAKASARKPGERIVVVALGHDLIYTVNEVGRLTGPTYRPSETRPKRYPT